MSTLSLGWFARLAALDGVAFVAGFCRMAGGAVVDMFVCPVEWARLTIEVA